MAQFDALNRYPLPRCMLIDACNDGLLTRIEKAQRKDADVKRIIDLVEARKIDGYVIRGSILFKEIDGNL